MFAGVLLVGASCSEPTRLGDTPDTATFPQQEAPAEAMDNVDWSPGPSDVVARGDWRASVLRFDQPDRRTLMRVEGPGCAFEVASATPIAFSPDNRWIVFVSTEDRFYPGLYVSLLESCGAFRRISNIGHRFEDGFQRDTFLPTPLTQSIDWTTSTIGVYGDGDGFIRVDLDTGVVERVRQ